MNHNIFFFDFETTGLNPFYNDIIEVAIQSLGLNDIVPFKPKEKIIEFAVKKYSKEFI